MTDGTPATNADAVSSEGAYDVDDLRLELETEEGEVANEDVIVYNSQQTVEGDVYLTSENASEDLLADDRVVDYEFVDPDGSVVANGDTNTGEFSVSETWDATRTNNSNKRYDGLKYNVNVGDDGVDNGNQSSDTFTTLLDINWEIDGVDVEDADVTHDETVQISGTVEDGSGNAIDNYRVGTSMYDEDNNVAKTGTTRTGNDGQFSFTFRFNDGVQDPELSTIYGDDPNGYGVQLGTHNVSQVDFGFENTANGIDHSATRYGTLPTEPQEASIDIEAQDDSPLNFEDTYTIEVTDEDGDPIEGARVYVDGEFDIEDGDTDYNDFEDAGNFTVDSSGSITQGTPVVDEENDVLEGVHLTTNSSGIVEFTATPLDNFAANVTAEDTTIETPDFTTITPESSDDNGQNGEFEIYGQPDYAQKNLQEFTVGDPSPVNVIGLEVEDPQTENPDSATDDSPTYTNILTDDGPAVVEVLPLAEDTDERLVGPNDDRLGWDGNQDLDGITQYRVSFELRNESNQLIEPGEEDGEFDRIEIRGPSINATISEDDDTGDVTFDSRNNNVVDAAYDSGEYVFLLRPTSVDEDDAEINHEVHVNGEDPVDLSLDTAGLEVSEFQVDGDEVDEVPGSTTLNLTSVVNAPYDNDAPVNNGRVRLTQTGYDLDANTDARTANVNNGEYEFANVSLGPRGIDDNGDGIGEDVSELVFTAYQYNDSSEDGALERDEVDRAAVEQLDLALNDSLQVEYDAENTSTYSGMDDGAFTLTRGVEYDQIAFYLKYENGDPVNLTDGIDDTEISSLNDLAHNADSEETELVTLSSSGEDLSVRFDEDASNTTAGHYVISDIENNGDANVSSQGSNIEDDDSFVFDSGDTVDAPAQPFTLDIETPDRSYSTNTSETGTFMAADAMLEGEIVGVSGTNVPNSTEDPDDLGHNATDNFNTNVSDIDVGTIGIDRTYRVNATVTDAVGNELNASDFAEIRVNNTGAESGTVDYSPVDGYEGFEIVDDDDGEVEINNENGTFQYDFQPTDDTESDGILNLTWEIEAQEDVDEDPMGVTNTTGGPAAQNPVVEVYDRSGAELPEDDETENQILAKDVSNSLRVEAFPASPNDFVLPDGQTFGFADSDPKSEDTAGTTTTLRDSVVTPDFTEGQVGFLSVTPTGTGDAIMHLTNEVDGENFGDGGAVQITDLNGNDVVFDVLNSNFKVNLTLSETEVGPGDEVTVALTQTSTGNALPANVSVSLIDPSDERIVSELTNEDGEVVLTVPEDASDGTYTVSTRPAGYEPNSVEMSVSSAEPANFEVSSLDAPGTVTQGDDVTASATIENTGETEATQTVEFRFAGDTLATENVTLDGGESQTVEFTVSTEGVDAGTYTHGVFTDDDSQTAELTIEAAQTETPTETPTDSPTEDDTTTEEGDGDGPGFGIAVALVALLGAAMLAARRNN
ncbi:PGF-CTERM sorting domain-containing protein [Halapricum desulfuricans]|uniref:PGF-CTERM sorting domain-containing protein n=1 Tax=Halapricum desulfuricans TaxID=2841257 RepID=UPI001E5C837E|nr:PGF-CTERM sorting domain-containing protein [Halapricum desulfuricans]